MMTTSHVWLSYKSTHRIFTGDNLTFMLFLRYPHFQNFDQTTKVAFNVSGDSTLGTIVVKGNPTKIGKLNEILQDLSINGRKSAMSR